MRAGRGVYALLLGSGVSRAARIPTGAEIVDHLIHQVATARGETIEGEAAAWFARRFGEAPRYDTLLAQLARTPAERQQLLARYFEPTEAERARGEKVPTRAHHAVASLVAGGYLRVIVTTNFDRLIESAIEARSVQPAVIASVDAVAGMVPLEHSSCTVIKVNGDYRDTRIRNTPDELDAYELPLDRLLDRVFDNYGLVVCGWSGDWDQALARAIERAPARRYTTFWTRRESDRSPVAERLIKARAAEVIRIVSADEFFERFAQTVKDLEALQAPHPLTTPLAVERLKQQIEQRHVIRIADGFREAADVVRDGIEQPAVALGTTPGENVLGELRRYDTLLERLAAMLVIAVRWGDDIVDDKTLVSAVERIANAAGYTGGHTPATNLKLYPALSAVYVAGIAAVASKNYTRLRAILGTRIQLGVRGQEELMRSVYPENVVQRPLANLMPGMSLRLTPLSDHLYAALRGALRDSIPESGDYDDLFDRFEYLVGLSYAVRFGGRQNGTAWGPVGRFHWRFNDHRERHQVTLSNTEIELLKGHWPPYRLGVFGDPNNFAKFAEVKKAYDDMCLGLPWR